MKTKNLIIMNKGYSNEHVTFVIGDYHGEHSLPKMNHVTLRCDWDGFEALGVLEDCQDHFAKNVDFMHKAAFENHVKKMKEDTDVNGYNFPSEGYTQWDDPTIHIWAITIWGTHLIAEYYDRFKDSVITVVEEASGDDDFFDYTPNYVDMFMQFASMIGMEKDYNALIDQVYAARPEMAEEELFGKFDL